MPPVPLTQILTLGLLLLIVQAERQNKRTRHSRFGHFTQRGEVEKTLLPRTGCVNLKGAVVSLMTLMLPPFSWSCQIRT